ncbi:MULTISPECIES: hypothetical protein [Stenotrophomonas]|nr:MULTISPECIES: hypothetical protein [Stenotrophomonas]QGM01376.1 hypothetical protein FEO89_11795 [Stenotrophomonas maltophilia]HDS1510710.1 hypothetical protein [Stenotrophomonas maltophilia]
MMQVGPKSRQVTASQADAHGALKERGNVFAGQLPSDAIVANTAVDWSGIRWTQRDVLARLRFIHAPHHLTHLQCLRAVTASSFRH